MGEEDFNPLPCFVQIRAFWPFSIEKTCLIVTTGEVIKYFVSTIKDCSQCRQGDSFTRRGGYHSFFSVKYFRPDVWVCVSLSISVFFVSVCVCVCVCVWVDVFVCRCGVWTNRNRRANLVIRISLMSCSGISRYCIHPVMHTYVNIV